MRRLLVVFPPQVEPSQGSDICLCNAVWQHPSVDVFRYCNLKQWPQGNCTKEGNVKVAMVCVPKCLNSLLHVLRKQPHNALQERPIGHQVITLAGAVPAANYLRLPKDKVDSLALTGRFLYLQVLCSAGMCYLA